MPLLAQLLDHALLQLARDLLAELLADREAFLHHAGQLLHELLPAAARFAVLLNPIALSTPEQRCIGSPEQKYIIDAGKKAAGPGYLSSQHHRPAAGALREQGASP